ncbi:hypothetical protein [Neorhizobium tomejilense]|uniref:hypothetical protein n=1 Tax=Neorhizobium tomejilense TaxID=2093828 RepID=UPI000CF9A56C|nr:hypothetical protein [Neorhizobium tomejilense]
MEQATRKRAHIERILLVCGEQNAGKSRLIRHMLGDFRLGGNIPTSAVIPPRALSRERRLAVRVTSPHEMGETPVEFVEKIDRASEVAWAEGFWRLNYVSAVQPRAANNMPDIADICDVLHQEFWPERIRVVLLSPNVWDIRAAQLTNAEVDRLRALDVEVLTIDARKSNHPVEPGNVRILADYLDFT